MWGYWWGLTAAQIDLMALDAPIIVYDHKKDKKKGGKREFKKVNALDYAKAKVEWENKYSGKENEKVTFDLTGFNLPKSENNNNTNT